MLKSASRLPVLAAVDGQPVEPGNIYVAVPDRHLLLIDGTVRLGEGPRENLVRPSIDPMMRSAALFYGPRAVGVILTGMLNDGAAGLHAIKRRGGTAVVQHPVDAFEPSMPTAALETVQADHVTSADQLAALLTEIVRTDAGPPPEEHSDNLIFEVEVAAGARLGSEQLRRFADPSPISCPDCHGVLSEVREGQPLRFRCQIGHAYTAEVMAAHTGEVDEAMRIAMRVMEERVTLVERMAKDARDTGRSAVAELYEGRSLEYRRYATVLRDAAILATRMRRQVHEQDI
jgi:two-component system chemotaxis response regulator CheB